MRSIFAAISVFLILTARARANAEPLDKPEPIAVTIRVDASRERGQLPPIWRFFGADEPNYAYMKDGRKLLADLGGLRPGSVYFRTHNLLTSGDGTPALKWGSTGAYGEDAQGRPIYNWSIVDRIFDTYRQRGVRPYVEIGFMPRELSVKPEPYQHHWTPTAKYDEIYTGWAYPPTDYAKWGELVHQCAKHCVEKYGRAAVESWYWETWNEANIGYWRGTPEEFRKLHDYAIDAVKRALPSARVGGADSAGSGGKWTRDFLEHCLRGTNYATGKTGTPIDFVSFHAKGSPTFVDGHVRMGIANHLRTVNEGFRIVASFPELKGKPIVIGESDPEGCAACQGPQLGYRNGTMYSSYTAASFARKYDLAERVGVNLEGALSWAFEFEEQPYFAGFRVLATNGINLPVLNVFRMFSLMGGRRLEVKSSGEVDLDTILAEGVRGAPDVSALAALDENGLSILAWHYHDDDVPGPDAEVALEISGLAASAAGGQIQIRHYRVDRDHSNAYQAWKRMGSPPNPTPGEYAEVQRASQLATVDSPEWLRVERGVVKVRMTLPRQAVSLLKIHSPAAAGRARGADGAAPRPKYSPIERMMPARLKAAHEDVQKISRLRRALPPLPGLNDYRAILHAHAEDSDHTGGTRPEMLADAKRADVHAIFLTDHFRPPRDFVADSWHGLREGVLFVPGSEDRGFLIYPTRSIIDRMKEPTPAFIQTVKRDGGLIFLSHIEERPTHSMEGLDGMEISNRHADAKVDRAGILSVMLKLTDPASLEELEESLKLYPDELFASQGRYPADYLAKWDTETQSRRLTGVAANDCHHNQVLIVKMVDGETVRVGTNVDRDDEMRSVSAALRPGIRALTKSHNPGDVLARLDIDPYHRSFRNLSTHILARALDEPSIRSALRDGHAYVSHDWMCDPTGSMFDLIPTADGSRCLMGDEVRFADDQKLVARFPVPCHIRLLRVGRLIAERSADKLEHKITAPGVYRIEGWLEVGGEERPWVYSNPIYVR
ncbi:MAG: GH39 family glycosyl hydrolase [Isosphaeraceae bacterium]